MLRRTTITCQPVRFRCAANSSANVLLPVPLAPSIPTNVATSALIGDVLEDGGPLAGDDRIGVAVEPGWHHASVQTTWMVPPSRRSGARSDS